MQSTASEFDFATELKRIAQAEQENSRKAKKPNNNMTTISKLQLQSSEIRNLHEELSEFENALVLLKSKNRYDEDHELERKEAKFSNFIEGINCLSKDMELTSMYRQLAAQNIYEMNSETLEDVTEIINFSKPGLRRKSFSKELTLTHEKKIIYTPPSSRTVIRVEFEEIIAFINSKKKLNIIDISFIYFQLLAIQPMYSKNPQICRAMVNRIFSENYKLNLIIPLSEQLHKERSKYTRFLMLALKDNSYLPLIRFLICSYTKALKTVC
ncbi:hypothetical protein [Pseudoalteromonas marina]|uniref:Fido domain-containing protein n=1 Tax=Pseudoalteromonas marina TaxID=267375 RepID=A0ABT9FCX2_9GAMM|nr:hypothetical protein [Pseudoalteromonas marina]MDP2564485.1 hypothetical protein [Pseudoalteromonas marina]